MRLRYEFDDHDWHPQFSIDSSPMTGTDASGLTVVAFIPYSSRPGAPSFSVASPMIQKSNGQGQFQIMPPSLAPGSY